jgi:hypothetical protein
MIVYLRQLTSEPLQKIDCIIELALVNEKSTPEFTRGISKATAKFRKV